MDVLFFLSFCCDHIHTIISNTVTMHDGRFITLFLNFCGIYYWCVVPPNDYCKISILREDMSVVAVPVSPNPYCTLFWQGM